LSGYFNFFLMLPLYFFLSRLAGQHIRPACTGPFVHGWVEYAAFALLVSAAAFVQNLLNIVLHELDGRASESVSCSLWRVQAL
jgi:hypothetical protein